MASDKKGEVPDHLVRAELEKILADPTFRRSGRLCSFLAFVVQHTLDGTAASLKEYTIGTEVYGKGNAFDPRNDSTVRVEAARLRAKLREYYDTAGRDDPVRIELPKGTYTPVFQPIEPEVKHAGTSSRAASRSSRTYVLVAAFVMMGIGSILLASLFSPARTIHDQSAGSSHNASRIRRPAIALTGWQTGRVRLDRAERR